MVRKIDNNPNLQELVFASGFILLGFGAGLFVDYMLNVHGIGPVTVGIAVIILSYIIK